MRRRGRTLTAVFAVIAAVTGVAPAQAGSPDRTYVRYAVVRDEVRGCVLDRTYHHLGADRVRRCRRLRPLYALYAETGESSDFHLHCYTSRCPPTPTSEPPPRGAIPAGVRVFRP